jgi:hypothetical protein
MSGDLDLHFLQGAAVRQDVLLPLNQDHPIVQEEGFTSVETHDMGLF